MFCVWNQCSDFGCLETFIHVIFFCFWNLSFSCLSWSILAQCFLKGAALCDREEWVHCDWSMLSCIVNKIEAPSCLLAHLLSIKTPWLYPSRWPGFDNPNSASQTEYRRMNSCGVVTCVHHIRLCFWLQPWNHCNKSSYCCPLLRHYHLSWLHHVIIHWKLTSPYFSTLRKTKLIHSSLTTDMADTCK